MFDCVTRNRSYSILHERLTMKFKTLPKCASRYLRRHSFQLSVVAFLVTLVIINREGHLEYENTRNELEIARATVVKVKNGRTFSNLSSRNIPELVRTTYHESLAMYSHLFIPRWDVITPLDFKFKAATRAGCGDNHPFLVFVILSMTKNRVFRDAVRNTWGSVSSTNAWVTTPLEKRVMVVFVIGTSSDDSALERESIETGDIIHVSVKEDYYNLTYKVLMGYLWILYNCKNVDFIAKIDEDTFPDVPVFIKTLSSVDMSDTIMGPCFTRGRVERRGKYAVSFTSYAPDVFPPHCKGNFYLMPADLAFRVLSAAQHVPYVNMEDAHLTGIVPASFGGVRFRGLTEAQYHLHDPPGMCEYVKGTIIVGQKVGPSLAMAIWRRFQVKSLCSKHK